MNIKYLLLFNLENIESIITITGKIISINKKKNI